MKKTGMAKARKRVCVFVLATQFEMSLLCSLPVYLGQTLRPPIIYYVHHMGQFKFNYQIHYNAK